MPNPEEKDTAQAVDKDPLTGLPKDLHIGNFAQALCKRLAVPGMITLLSNEDGTIMMISHGINHARAAEMLARGVQINLNQHDEYVRQGHAGAVAQAQQGAIDYVSTGGLTQ